MRRGARDEQLFRRATEIALQARAGDQALAAVMAGAAALPRSIEAHRYLIQLLVALNRADESIEPMRSLIQLTPEAERPGLIQSLPGFFSRTGDKTQTPALVERVVQDWITQPATRTAARVALARAWLGVPDAAKALPLLQQAHADDPGNESGGHARPPAWWAHAGGRGHRRLVPEDEARQPRRAPELRARADQRAALWRCRGAARRNDHRLAPDMAPPWLTLGALQVELRHPAGAITALKTYLGKSRTPGHCAGRCRRRRR